MHSKTMKDYERKPRKLPNEECPPRSRLRIFCLQFTSNHPYTKKVRMKKLSQSSCVTFPNGRENSGAGQQFDFIYGSNHVAWENSILIWGHKITIH